MADISKWNSMSRSLLLPLYFRAVETDKSNPIISDKKAKEVIGLLDYDFSKISDFDILHTATMMREAAFDEVIKKFLYDNTSAVVINIGSGLDTRFFRLDNGEIDWYELDLPEVIETRKEIFQESERHHFIASSAFDLSWTDKIKKNRPLLLIAEGVLCYFQKSDVQKFILKLKDKFKGACFCFDAVSNTQVWMSRFNPALAMMDLWFKWGLNFVNELDHWDNNIETKDVIYYFKPSIERLGWYTWYSVSPAVKFGFYIISCIFK